MLLQTVVPQLGRFAEQLGRYSEQPAERPPAVPGKRTTDARWQQQQQQQLLLHVRGALLVALARCMGWADGREAPAIRRTLAGTALEALLPALPTGEQGKVPPECTESLLQPPARAAPAYLHHPADDA